MIVDESDDEVSNFIISQFYNLIYFKILQFIIVNLLIAEIILKFKRYYNTHISFSS